MSGVTLGTRYDVEPIPPIPENTRVLDAGTVQIGVEFRHLTDDIVTDNFASDPDAATIIDAARPEQLSDQGFSIHIFDAESRDEYLRFDLFDGEPHYHYIVPRSHNVVIAYDQHACGDMLEWALECLRRRLPQMLRYAGADALADVVQQERVDAVIPEILAITQDASTTRSLTGA